jgi:hypothetical protein
VRSSAIANATAWFDGGGLFDELSRRVGIRTESQNRDCADSLARYLTDEIGPAAERLGFRAEIWTTPSRARRRSSSRSASRTRRCRRC